MRKTDAITILILGGLALVFLIQNTPAITLPFLFWKISMSRIILILGSVLIGFVLGYRVGRK